MLEMPVGPAPGAGDRAAAGASAGGSRPRARVAPAPPPTPPTLSTRLARRVRRLRPAIATLFPMDVPVPPRRRTVAVGAIAVLAGAAVSLGRVRRGPGVFNTIWAEDGTDFLTDILNRPALETVLRPLNGYFTIVSRVLALPGDLVPLSWAPAVFSVEAALVAGLLAVAVYVASRTHLRSTLGRLVAAVPVVAVPVGENLQASTANNLATLQFCLVYASMWMLLWVPASRRGRVAAIGVVAATVLNTFLAVLLVPLAALRWTVWRDRTATAMLGLLVAGGFANLVALWTGLTARPEFLVPRYDPVWALRSLDSWALPNALFGFRLTDGRGMFAFHPVRLTVVCGAVIVVACAVAAWRTKPNWLLAGVIATLAALLTCASVMSAGRLELRYVVAPELMVFAAMAVLLRPRPAGPPPGSPAAARPPLAQRPGPAPGRRSVVTPPALALRRTLPQAPVAVLALFVALVCIANYRLESRRSVQGHPWSSIVDKGRAVCQDRQYDGVYLFPSAQGAAVGIPVGTPLTETPPLNWPVRVPCERLR